MSPNSCIKYLISWFQTFKKQSLCFYSLFSLGKLTLGQRKACTQDSCKGQGHSQAHNSLGHLWRRCWIRVCRETNSVKCIPSFTLNCTFGGKLLSSKLHRRLPLFYFFLKHNWSPLWLCRHHRDKMYYKVICKKIKCIIISIIITSTNHSINKCSLNGSLIYIQC